MQIPPMGEAGPLAEQDQPVAVVIPDELALCSLIEFI
jgi:hypothetical protein